VGSTVNFKRRSKRHITELRHQYHHSHKLQADFNAYGENAFKFEILEETDNLDKAYERETHWITTLRSYPDGYNLTYDAKHLHIDPETRRKAASANAFLFQDAAYREKCRLRAKRQFASPEARRAASERQKLFVKLNPERSRQNSIAARRAAGPALKKLLAKLVRRSDGIVYESIRDAGIALCPQHHELGRSRVRQSIKLGKPATDSEWSFKWHQ